MPDWQRFAGMRLGPCHNKATRGQQGLSSTSTCPTDCYLHFFAVQAKLGIQPPPPPNAAVGAQRRPMRRGRVTRG